MLLARFVRFTRKSRKIPPSLSHAPFRRTCGKITWKLCGLLGLLARKSRDADECVVCCETDCNSRVVLVCDAIRGYRIELRKSDRQLPTAGGVGPLRLRRAVLCRTPFTSCGARTWDFRVRRGKTSPGPTCRQRSISRDTKS